MCYNLYCVEYLFDEYSYMTNNYVILGKQWTVLFIKQWKKCVFNYSVFHKYLTNILL